MAEASNIKHSRFLFTKDDGSPINFRMTPCSEKKLLRPLVGAGGGQFTKEETPGTINLIEPTSIAKSNNLVSSTYVHDCIKENKLLDINDYSVLVGTQYISRTDQNQNSITMQSRSRSGRNTFFLSEDVNIIRFLLEEERYKRVNGVKMWQLMEGLKIVNHTWQSTKDHFLKIILPNINTYGFSPEKVAKFQQKTCKPVKGSDSHKRAAKFPLTYAGTGKDVEEEDEGEDEDALEDEDVDEFDQNLVQIAKSCEKIVTNDNRDTVGEGQLGEDADTEEGDVISKDASSGTELPDKDDRKRVKGLRGPRNHPTAADDGDQERPPSAGQENTPNSNAATKADSFEISNTPGNAQMQDIQNPGEGRRLRNAKRVGLREMKMQRSKAKKTCVTEIAIADSQNDRITDQDKELDLPRQRKRIAIDSSTEIETDVESEEVFPVVYSGKRHRKGQKEKEVTLPDQKGDSSSETMNKRSSSPQPCTSKQIPQEVSKKPKKSFGISSSAPRQQYKERNKRSGPLRDFVLNDSLRENTPEDAGGADINSQSADMQLVEKSLTTCDKLMTWLDLSHEIFVQAVYQCNGSVDCAVKWLLNGSGKIWEPNDDLGLYNGDRDRLEDKYSKEFVTERLNYLAENSVFQ